MTKSELIDKVNGLAIYENDYKVLRAMLDMGDDKLLVVILEEIARGRLRFTDLYPIINNGKYEQTLAQNLESQEALRREIERTIAFRKKVEDPSFSIDPARTGIGVTVQAADSKLGEFYSSEESRERSELIFDMLNPDENDDIVKRTAKLKLYESLKSEQFTQEDILLFARDYIVPVSYGSQVLNKSDISFMLREGISEGEMKKLKALSLFLRRGQTE
jgi:hypothetical protein